MKMNTEKDKKIRGVVLTLLGGILWGFCGSCGQFLFQFKEVNSDWLVPIRLTGAGLLILIVLWIKEKKKIFEVWNEIIALLCSMAGTFILATHGNVSQLAIPAKALLWGLLAAVALVVYTLQPAELMKKYTTIQTLGWGMFIGGGVLMLLRRPWNVHPVVDGQTVLAMAVIILLGTICAFYFYLQGVQLVGASNASMLACVEPVAATVISVVWLHVEFQMMDLLGFIFVLSTVFIVSLNQKKEEEGVRSNGR